MSDIVIRLRGPIKDAVLRLVRGAFRRDGERLSWSDAPRFTIPARRDCDDDLVTIEALESAAAEIEKLRAALEPFATALKGNWSHQPDDMKIGAGWENGGIDIRMHFTLGDFRRAAAAMEGK